MTPVEAAIKACHSMGVKFTVADDYPLEVNRGPVAGGCHPDFGVYMQRHDMTCGDAWAWILHELAHVVWWHPTHGADVCEKPLMAWEYAVARHFGIGGYWRCNYTTGTRVIVDGENRDVCDWKRPQRAAWFAEARQECVRRGALTLDFRPTWKMPVIQADGHDEW